MSWRNVSFALILAFLIASVGVARAENAVLNPTTSLHVDRNSDIANTVRTLSGRDRDDAAKIAAFPIATWLTGGSPADVRSKVATLASDAARARQIPVVVAYNIPYRDCQQYSAGGAADGTAYKAWIDGLAAGIGEQKMVVILEPDGLGIIPHYTPLKGEAEWCRPSQLGPAAADQRFELLNYAVDALRRLPNTATYLDGTHSGWLEVGDIAKRLVRAGVLRSTGFFLNVSNYEPTAQLEKYGTWISKCIFWATTTDARRQDFKRCASQFSPAKVDDFSTWHLSDAWYTQNADAPLTTPQLRHFVIDTSRNGRGQWSAPTGRYKDPQRWCNPPDRGLGERPTTTTGHPLIDAKLWIKVPGESDGQCTRGTAGLFDPARGMIDPPAGKWFKEQAAELIRLAEPEGSR